MSTKYNIRGFQFLIGKIQTTVAEAALKNKIKFQFLIGKIQTKIVIRNLKKYYEFQFLIGKIQTPNASPFVPPVMPVSIPYRKDTN